MVPKERQEGFTRLMISLSLMKDCLGWDLIDEQFFLPMVMKRGGKRLRKKKAKQLRLKWVGYEMRNAGLVSIG
jgi:hypothetical protein